MKHGGTSERREQDIDRFLLKINRELGRGSEHRFVEARRISGTAFLAANGRNGTAARQRSKARASDA